MSQYINFFIKDKENFIPIAIFPRSHSIYRLFSDFPWEKIKPVKKTKLADIKNDISATIEAAKKTIKDNEETIKCISEFNNDVAEKLEAIREYKNYINEEKVFIHEYDYAKHFLLFIEGIIENNDNPEECVYAGIEISKPTIDDIAAHTPSRIY